MITDFKHLKPGNAFPPSHEDNVRIARYKLNGDRFTGDYAKNKLLIVKSSSGAIKTLPWQLLKLNKFKLYTNKMDSLIFNRDPVIKSGNRVTDKLIYGLVERTQWVRHIRKALRNMETFGDAPIKTYKGGISAFNPSYFYKVVDKDDKDIVIAYVLYQYIYNDIGLTTNIRFEAHFKGYVYEWVQEYNGAVLGRPVEYKFNDYLIPVEGLTYNTGVDEFLVQHLACDVPENNVYGQSPYEDYASLVHEAERRQTLASKILDSHSEPMLSVGVGFLKENSETGQVEAFDILGNIIEVPNGQTKPEYITWDGKLESNDKMIDLLFSEIYEATELGKTFMTGEYLGNISDDTLNSLVKSATDRANRHVWDIYYEVRKSLYVLCRLNDIDVSLKDLSVVFQIGQSDNIKTLAETAGILVENQILSKQTVRQTYFEFDEQQAIEEESRINKERGQLDE